MMFALQRHSPFDIQYNSLSYKSLQKYILHKRGKIITVPLFVKILYLFSKKKKVELEGNLNSIAVSIAVSRSVSVVV